MLISLLAFIVAAIAKVDGVIDQHVRGLPGRNLTLSCPEIPGKIVAWYKIMILPYNEIVRYPQSNVQRYKVQPRWEGEVTVGEDSNNQTFVTIALRYPRDETQFLCVDVASKEVFAKYYVSVRTPTLHLSLTSKYGNVSHNAILLLKGTTARIMVSVPSKDSSPEITWSIGGHVVGHTQSVSVTPINSWNNEVLECKVKTKSGVVSDQRVISVHYAPVVIKENRGSKKLNFYVSPGNPKANIVITQTVGTTLVRPRVPYNQSTFSTGDYPIEIIKVAFSDDSNEDIGLYAFTITNLLGNSSTTIRLSTYGHIEITEHRNIVAEVGSTFEVSAKFYSVEHPYYLWSHELSGKTNYFYQKSHLTYLRNTKVRVKFHGVDVRMKGYEVGVTIDRATISDGGKYTLEVYGKKQRDTQTTISVDVVNSLKSGSWRIASQIIPGVFYVAIGATLAILGSQR